MSKTKDECVSLLESMGACYCSVRWLKDSKFVTAQEAWDSCNSGDWMLWFIGKLVVNGSVEHKRLVLCACECARLSLKYVKAGELRPLKAIETAEAWSRNEPGTTLEEVRKAAAAAAYAAAAYAADTAVAVSAAADTAVADTAVAVSAAAVAAAYAAVSAAADTAAADAAREETLKTCADIVRKHFPDTKQVMEVK